MQEGHDRAEHRFALAHDLKIAMAEHDPVRHDEPPQAAVDEADRPEPSVRDQVQRFGDLREHHAVPLPHAEAAQTITGEDRLDPRAHRLELFDHGIIGFGMFPRAADQGAEVAAQAVARVHDNGHEVIVTIEFSVALGGPVGRVEARGEPIVHDGQGRHRLAVPPDEMVPHLDPRIPDVVRELVGAHCVGADSRAVPPAPARTPRGDTS